MVILSKFPKKVLATLIIFAVVASFSASLIPSVAAGSAWTRSGSEVTAAGDTVSYVFSLSGDNEDFSLSTSSLPSGWSATFFYGNQQINSINVQGIESVSVTMEITTNSSTLPGNYSFYFIASSSSETLQYSLNLEILSPNGLLEMSSPYPSTDVKLGQVATYQVTVTNNLGISEYMILNATIPSNWSTDFVANGKYISAIYLPAGGSQSITVELTPATSESAGTANFTIMATSQDGSVNATLNLTANVYETSTNQNIVMTCTYPSVSATVGQSISYPIMLSNEGSTGELLNLNCTAPSGWNVSYTATGLSGVGVNSIYLTAGSSQSLTLVATPPYGESLGNASFLLNAIDTYGNVEANLVLNASIVQPTGEVNVLSTFTVMTANVGSTLQYPLTIENSRSVDTTLNLSAVVPQGWSAVFYSGSNQISNIVLTSEESTSLVLKVTPPSSVTLGNYTVTINAQSSDGTVNQQLNLTADLLGSYSISATPGAYSTSIATGGSTSITVTVTNTGQSTITSLSLDVTPPDSTWTITTAPSKVQSLSAGESATFTMQITSPSDTVAGDYLMSVTATSDQASSSSFQVRVTDNASTSWVWIGLLIAIVAVIAMIFLFRKFGRR